MYNKTILVTGGAGFIGSHLVELLVKKYSKYKIINLDLLTYAGDLVRVSSINKKPNYLFIKGDICDVEFMNKLFVQHCINGVMHLAAESHVDNSISNPRVFVDTNVIGTQVLLDSAKKLWLEKPGKLFKQFAEARFLHVSTDEVYGTLGETGFFTEETPYAPNSPYSASKAASDFIARSYFYTYGLPLVISNCSNNFGPKQNNEKLIPTVIKNAIDGNNIPIYGNGKNIRDWLYVEDHCSALDLIFHQGKLGESYNIGTHNEKTNISLIKELCKLLDNILPKKQGRYQDQLTYVQDRAGHDFRYAIDNTKICTELKWNPVASFKETLEKTIKWYINYYGK